MHQLIEARRKSDNRKVHRCVRCEQEWTYWPKIACPGVPVVPWNSKAPGTLRTRTQAKKEHYLLPDDARPAAALRLDSDPWYIMLYDVSQCEQRLPTEEQLQRVARREQTLRERYGCCLCSKRYLKKEAACHINGVCQNCHHRATGWNEVLQWARDLMADPPCILALATEPARRSVRSTRRGYYRLTGYQSIDLVTGELIAEKQLSHPEDYAVLYGLLQLSQIAGAMKKPLFLFPAPGDYLIFWWQLLDMFGAHIADWSWTKLTTTLPTGLHVPLPDRDWIDSPDEALAQPLYYSALCEILGLTVEPDASVASMLRQIVGHLATREMIKL